MTEGRKITRRALFTGRASEGSKDPDTVTNISIPGIGVVRLVSSVHITGNTLAELGPAVALGFETGNSDIYGGEDAMVNVMSLPSVLMTNVQYKNVSTEAQKRELPIFFIDVYVSSKDSEIDQRVGEAKNPGYINRRKAMLVVGLSGVVGATAFGYKKGIEFAQDFTIPGQTEGSKNIGIEMLEWMAAMFAAVKTVKGGMRVSMRDVTSMLGRYMLAINKEEKERGFLDFTIKIRDLVFAEKLIFALEMCKEMGMEEPTIAGFVGASHAEGVAEALALSREERQAFLRGLAAHIGERRFDDYDGVEAMRRLLKDATILPMTQWRDETASWDFTRFEMPSGPAEVAGTP